MLSAISPSLLQSAALLSEFFCFFFNVIYTERAGVGDFPGGLALKNSPEKEETWVRYLGQEDPLEKEMATHSNILAWEILWTEEPLGPWGCKESDMT